MIVKNDKEFLEKHLPIVRPCFDGAVAVDAESADGSQAVLKRHGFDVVNRRWNNNFADARNAAIKRAEELKFDYMFMLDADECMFQRDIHTVREYMEDWEFICLPRIEFVKDTEHFNPTLYPDFQGRVFKLGVYFHYQNRVHEMLWKGKDKKKAREVKTNNPLKLPNCHIYHYGRCKPKEELWLKHQNYARLMEGKELLDSVPEGVVVNETEVWGGEPVKYHGLQPILP